MVEEPPETDKNTVTNTQDEANIQGQNKSDVDSLNSKKAIINLDSNDPSCSIVQNKNLIPRDSKMVWKFFY